MPRCPGISLEFGERARPIPGNAGRHGKSILGIANGGSQSPFLAQVGLEDSRLPLRSGMSGQAKIYSGRATLARVIFRKPARWLWGVIWGWLP